MLTQEDIQTIKREVADVLAAQTPRQFVIAGAYSEFNDYLEQLKRHDHDTSKYVYLTSVDQVRYLEPPFFSGFVLLGSYYNHPYYNSEQYIAKQKAASDYWKARIDESLEKEVD